MENTKRRTRKKSVQNIPSVRTFNIVKYLVVDKKFYRKENKIILVADNTLAKKKLNFKPSKSFEEIVHEMVDFEIGKLEK